MKHSEMLDKNKIDREAGVPLTTHWQKIIKNPIHFFYISNVTGPTKINKAKRSKLLGKNLET